MPLPGPKPTSRYPRHPAFRPTVAIADRHIANPRHGEITMKRHSLKITVAALASRQPLAAAIPGPEHPGGQCQCRQPGQQRQHTAIPNGLPDMRSIVAKMPRPWSISALPARARPWPAGPIYRRWTRMTRSINSSATFAANCRKIHNPCRAWAWLHHHCRRHGSDQCPRRRWPRKSSSSSATSGIPRPVPRPRQGQRRRRVENRRQNLPTVIMGNSRQTEVGEWVPPSVFLWL